MQAYQEGRLPALNRKGRNVFQRHRTESGFTPCSDVDARAVMGRVLDSAEGRDCLVKWVTPRVKKVPHTVAKHFCFDVFSFVLLCSVFSLLIGTYKYKVLWHALVVAKTVLMLSLQLKH
jgi:hypothetical protein